MDVDVVMRNPKLMMRDGLLIGKRKSWSSGGDQRGTTAGLDDDERLL
jgi:hypothetical protein